MLSLIIRYYCIDFIILDFLKTTSCIKYTNFLSKILDEKLLEILMLFYYCALLSKMIYVQIIFGSLHYSQHAIKKVLIACILSKQTETLANPKISTYSV